MHEFELVADGMLVYRGWLRQGGASQPGAAADWQSIVLSDHPQVLEQERDSGRLVKPSGSQADDLTLLINDGKQMPNGGAKAVAPDAAPLDRGPAERPTPSCPPMGW